ncbi:MAG: methylated-DNA--[protein]-cysteine S-methyltransferase [SAR324 cluster bacterium]|jgi:methylated-DNA-[protein]-cysteine S-methyltransferase|nr:methylated-DNA--[protein]-cysteine S-methyltransferase [SAR324 cluster bacterium]MEC9384275.1 methylated-DNA--[protein]-cysteine S-methyltransferase [SAR324 cluster bacterium]MED5482441.1 methylated-DNA--[protein]-cysteine S-methyltransferase [SAR324 cluster bacterium]
MTDICIQYHKTKIGELILGSFEGKLCLLDFNYRKMRNAVDDRIKKGLNADFIEEDSEIIEKTRTELDEYFKENRREFDVPIRMVGTDFQKSVWNALLKVAYGTTSTYLQLAKDINNGKAVRAVAGANGANAIAIIIPCHRIIGSSGELVGYAGGLPTKKRLLTLEKKQEFYTQIPLPL